MPRESHKSKIERLRKIMAVLESTYPNAHCELNFTNPLELLIATILSAQRWTADAYLFALAVLGYGFALGGYIARRFRQAPWLRRTLGEYWVIAHLTGMIASYVVLLTAFYVDNAHLIPGLNRLPTLTFWVAPTLIALPFLALSIWRFLPQTPSSTTAVGRHDTRSALQARETGSKSTH